MSDCIFCKIINKDIPSEIVYEDEDVLAFLDIKPISQGHTLVVPKEHYENIFDVPKNVLNNTMNIVKKISKSIKHISDGVNIGQNNLLAAGQIVNHIHFHIIPRFDNDGLKSWPRKSYNEGQMRDVSEKIKKNIE